MDEGGVKRTGKSLLQNVVVRELRWLYLNEWGLKERQSCAKLDVGQQEWLKKLGNKLRRDGGSQLDFCGIPEPTNAKGRAAHQERAPMCRASGRAFKAGCAKKVYSEKLTDRLQVLNRARDLNSFSSISLLLCAMLCTFLNLITCAFRPV